MKTMRLLAVMAAMVLQGGCKPSSSTSNPAEQSLGFVQYFSGEPVQRGTPLQFPADHGSHPKQGIEWWYLTANLSAASGETFGLQWTLFRARLPETALTASGPDNPWWQGQMYFAHFALQSRGGHYAFERFGRAAQVHIQAAPFHASIDDWRLASINGENASSPTFLPLGLQAQDRLDDVAFAVDLNLDNSPIVVHGDAGYSQKTPQGDASYYYSLPFLSAAGHLSFKGKTYTVAGQAWLDREWSGGLIGLDYLGWDWFSLQSDDRQSAIMAFCVRGQTQRDQYCDATRITRHSNPIPTQPKPQPQNPNPNSRYITTQRIAHSDIRLEVLKTVRLGGKTYPIQWQLSLEADRFIIEAINPDSRNQLRFPYWEGRVSFRKKSSVEDGGLKGKGYAELTGY